MAQKTVLIWDNDGTVMGSANPNDSSNQARVLLPNVQRIMHTDGVINIICSGCKTPESELQNFDPQRVIERFTALMNTLPISLATFSPAIGGTQCYVVIKRFAQDGPEIRKAHEDARYMHLVGQFKKPGLGMLMVIQDLLQELYDTQGTNNLFFIGDTWHDEHAARAMTIPFIPAQYIHALSEEVEFDTEQFMKQ
jgi:hypothetical protein